MFLKQKKTGQVKGRGCADGRKQRVYYRQGRGDIANHRYRSCILTAVIDAMEGRCVAVMDVPGAFLQADMPEDEMVHVRLTCTMVTLLEINLDLNGPEERRCLP